MSTKKKVGYRKTTLTKSSYPILQAWNMYRTYMVLNLRTLVPPLFCLGHYHYSVFIEKLELKTKKQKYQL